MYRNITQIRKRKSIKHFSFIDYIYIAYKFWDNFNISKF